MADYNVIKHCRLCKERFLVSKIEAKKQYCDKCQKIVDKEDK